PQRRDGLQKPADNQLLAIAHAPFDPAGMVAVPGEAPRRAVVPDRILCLRARQSGYFEPVAHSNTLHRLNGHQGLRQPSVQPLVPIRAGAQPRRQPRRAHLEYSPHGVAGAQHLVHFRLHPLLAGRVQAVQQNLIPRRKLAQVTSNSGSRRAAPTATTWLRTSMPSAFNNSLASAPAATRAAVSRALARSRT